MVGAAVAEGRRLLVVDSLDKSALPLVTRAIMDGDVMLDLSEVTEAHESAVSLLARLPAGQCRFVGCPRWLAQRIERRHVELATEGW
jgi:hypothetical protein